MSCTPITLNKPRMVLRFLRTLLVVSSVLVLAQCQYWPHRAQLYGTGAFFHTTFGWQYSTLHHHYSSWWDSMEVDSVRIYWRGVDAFSSDYSKDHTVEPVSVPGFARPVFLRAHKRREDGLWVSQYVVLLGDARVTDVVFVTCADNREILTLPAAAAEVIRSLQWDGTADVRWQDGSFFTDPALNRLHFLMMSREAVVWGSQTSAPYSQGSLYQVGLLDSKLALAGNEEQLVEAAVGKASDRNLVVTAAAVDGISGETLYRETLRKGTWLPERTTLLPCRGGYYYIAELVKTSSDPEPVSYSEVLAGFKLKNR